MRALSDTSAVIHDKDVVGIHEGGRTLGDHDDGHVTAMRLQCRAQCKVGRIVERTHAVIKNEDGRFSGECTRDGEPLLLTSGEVASALYEVGIHAVLELADKFRCLRDLHGFLHLPIVRTSQTTDGDDFSDIFICGVHTISSLGRW